ncbi:hypothetical protein CFR71_12860 [Novacetimonas pomaceti]|uniref:Uncharacterized protein n=1 Tax=Novacetimonas pomaceti TaxID=2021998 RepID=A0A318Q7S2_9PROT|nr:hypothetical protein CFR71_12860 [Novacetimonas pomaceti]
MINGAWVCSPRSLLPKQPLNIKKFLVKLFSKSFEERRLFEKRQHPKTFIIQERDVGRGRVFSKRGANGSSTRK